jgi:cytochrome c peroxidase
VAAQPAPTPDPALGLPRIKQRDDAARIELGRWLFMDVRLSRDGSVSCSTCHVPEQGFAVNGTRTAVGIGGSVLRRNAPSVLNAGFNEALFHDGRAATLEEQAWGPLLAPDEMGNADRAQVVARIAAVPEFVQAFRAAFAAAPSEDSLAKALGAYQRSLVAAGSRFDRWYFGHEDGALSAQEKRGFVVFRGKAQCNACHKLGREHALFTDEQFHNLGVGFPAPGHAEAPGQLQDLGRYEVTGAAKDRFAFRTPTLRNVELTAPYMHDGSLATLRDVVDFYDRGGNPNPGLDPLMVPLYLSEAEKAALVAFLKTLSAPNVARLAAQARRATGP